MDLKNKTALVTGASRGIGRAIALALAERGARIGIHYNQNRSAAEETASLLDGDRHPLFQADLKDVDDIKKMIQGAVQQMGQIDILVNNAGVYYLHNPSETDFDTWHNAWEDILRTNLFGPAHLSYLVSRHMIKNGGGRIINISSRGAFRGEPSAPAYGASKAGMNAMGQSMAKALSHHDIYVYTVAPGFVETEMAADYLKGPEGDLIRNQSPMNRVAQPEEVAKIVVFMATEAPAFMTGAIVDINGASYLRT